MPQTKINRKTTQRSCTLHDVYAGSLISIKKLQYRTLSPKPAHYVNYHKPTSALLTPPSPLLFALYPIWLLHRKILCGRLKVRTIMDYLYYFHSAGQIDMLFKSFEEEPACSPLSTLESLPPHDLPLNSPFRLAPDTQSPHALSLRRSHEV